MRVKTIAKILERASKWRARGYVERADALELQAAEMLAADLERWKARHPLSWRGLQSYHKLHGTGTGSGGHNTDPATRKELAAKRWAIRRARHGPTGRKPAKDPEAARKRRAKNV